MVFHSFFPCLIQFIFDVCFNLFALCCVPVTSDSTTYARSTGFFMFSNWFNWILVAPVNCEPMAPMDGDEPDAPANDGCEPVGEFPPGWFGI